MIIELLRKWKKMMPTFWFSYFITGK